MLAAAACSALLGATDPPLRCARRYQAAPSGLWHAALFEQAVVEQLQNTQFETYMKKVQTSDCAAEMKR